MRLEPWPPPRGLAPVLDLVLDCYPPQELALDQIDRIFAPDAVLTSPPLDAAGAFRHYFGREGARDAFRESAERFPEIDVIPDRWAVAGHHAVVICRVERDGAEPVEAAWLCTERDGRTQLQRGFRYPAEALERFAALTGED